MTSRRGRAARLGVGLVLWILWPLLKWGLIVALPFGVLLRGLLHAYHQEWPLLVALVAGFVGPFWFFWPT